MRERPSAGVRGGAAPGGAVSSAGPLATASPAGAELRTTGIAELDRVLGGGLAGSGAYLVAGEPGIGKSTLLLQVALHTALRGERVLLVCGEETAEQVRLRAERLGGTPDQLWATRASEIPAVLAAIDEASPSLVIVDSVQSLALPDVPGVPGSVGQVRACGDTIVRAAKDRGVTVVLVGQATKDGQVAGPRTLEHLVDAVLWFEGDRGRPLRLLRATKNRFGPAHEVGCFRMTTAGLEEVSDPSRLLVGERDVAIPGVAVAPLLEGNRPLLVEVQALVGPTSVPAPRRTASGIDGQRLSLLTAVLERRGRLRLGGHDVFVGTMGGVRATEPSVDLAVCLAVASAFIDRPLEPWTVAIGEVGLSGEVRDAPDIPRRLNEAKRLGFRRAIVPAVRNLSAETNVQLFPVRDVGEALAHIEPVASRDVRRANAPDYAHSREHVRRSHVS
jgi:DNA repair protein RadA/Sms